MANKFQHLKMDQPSMKDAVDVEDTDMLDGEAKDSPVFMESNKTQQHTTGNIPKDNLGGKNDPNG